MTATPANSPRFTIPTLYYDALCPQSRSCLMLIKILDIKVDLKPINLIIGEHLSDFYRKINPSSTVPTLIDGQFMLSNGHTIMIYLCDKYEDLNQTHLCPRDNMPRINVLNILFYDSSVLHKRYSQLLAEILSKKYPNIDMTYHEAKVKDSYNTLDAKLKDQSYMAGNNLTIADLSVITTVSGLDFMFPISRDQWPNLHKWFENLQTLDCYAFNTEGVQKLSPFLEAEGQYPLSSQAKELQDIAVPNESDSDEDVEKYFPKIRTSGIIHIPSDESQDAVSESKLELQTGKLVDQELQDSGKDDESLEDKQAENGSCRCCIRSPILKKSQTGTQKQQILHYTDKEGKYSCNALEPAVTTLFAKPISCFYAHTHCTGVHRQRAPYTCAENAGKYDPSCQCAIRLSKKKGGTTEKDSSAEEFLRSDLGKNAVALHECDSKCKCQENVRDCCANENKEDNYACKDDNDYGFLHIICSSDEDEEEDNCVHNQSYIETDEMADDVAHMQLECCCGSNISIPTKDDKASHIAICLCDNKMKSLTVCYNDNTQPSNDFSNGETCCCCLSDDDVLDSGCCNGGDATERDKCMGNSENLQSNENIHSSDNRKYYRCTNTTPTGHACTSDEDKRGNWVEKRGSLSCPSLICTYNDQNRTANCFSAPPVSCISKEIRKSSGRSNTCSKSVPPSSKPQCICICDSVKAIVPEAMEGSNYQRNAKCEELGKQKHTSGHKKATQDKPIKESVFESELFHGSDKRTFPNGAKKSSLPHTPFSKTAVHSQTQTNSPLMPEFGKSHLTDTGSSNRESAIDKANAGRYDDKSYVSEKSNVRRDEKYISNPIMPFPTKRSKKSVFKKNNNNETSKNLEKMYERPAGRALRNSEEDSDIDSHQAEEREELDKPNVEWICQACIKNNRREPTGICGENRTQRLTGPSSSIHSKKPKLEDSIILACSPASPICPNDVMKLKCVEFECREEQDSDSDDQCPCSFDEGELRKCHSCLCIAQFDDCTAAFQCDIEMPDDKEATPELRERYSHNCDCSDHDFEHDGFQKCDNECQCQLNAGEDNCECCRKGCLDDLFDCEPDDEEDNLICCCEVEEDNSAKSCSSEVMHCHVAEAEDRLCYCDDESQTSNDELNAMECCNENDLLISPKWDITSPTSLRFCHTPPERLMTLCCNDNRPTVSDVCRDVITCCCQDTDVENDVMCPSENENHCTTSCESSEATEDDSLISNVTLTLSNEMERESSKIERKHCFPMRDLPVVKCGCNSNATENEYSADEEGPPTEAMYNIVGKCCCRDVGSEKKNPDKAIEIHFVSERNAKAIHGLREYEIAAHSGGIGGSLDAETVAQNSNADTTEHTNYRVTKQKCFCSCEIEEMTKWNISQPKVDSTIEVQKHETLTQNRKTFGKFTTTHRRSLEADANKKIVNEHLNEKSTSTGRSYSLEHKDYKGNKAKVHRSSINAIRKDHTVESSTGETSKVADETTEKKSAEEDAMMNQQAEGDMKNSNGVDNDERECISQEEAEATLVSDKSESGGKGELDTTNGGVAPDNQKTSINPTSCNLENKGKAKILDGENKVSRNINNLKPCSAKKYQVSKSVNGKKTCRPIDLCNKSRAPKLNAHDLRSSRVCGEGLATRCGPINVVYVDCCLCSNKPSTSAAVSDTTPINMLSHSQEKFLCLKCQTHTSCHTARESAVSLGRCNTEESYKAYTQMQNELRKQYGQSETVTYRNVNGSICDNPRNENYSACVATCSIQRGTTCQQAACKSRNCCANGNQDHVTYNPSPKKLICIPKSAARKSKRLKAGSSKGTYKSSSCCRSAEKNEQEFAQRVSTNNRLQNTQRYTSHQDIQDSTSNISQEEIRSINKFTHYNNFAAEKSKTSEDEKCHIKGSKIPRLLLPKVYQVYRESQDLGLIQKSKDFSKLPPSKLYGGQGKYKYQTPMCSPDILKKCCSSSASRIPLLNRQRVSTKSRSDAPKNSRVSHNPYLSKHDAVIPNNSDTGSLTCSICEKYLKTKAAPSSCLSGKSLSQFRHHTLKSSRSREITCVTTMKCCDSKGRLIKEVSRITVSSMRKDKSSDEDNSLSSINTGRFEKKNSKISIKNHNQLYDLSKECQCCQCAEDRTRNLRGGNDENFRRLGSARLHEMKSWDRPTHTKSWDRPSLSPYDIVNTRSYTFIGDMQFPLIPRPNRNSNMERNIIPPASGQTNCDHNVRACSICDNKGIYEMKNINSPLYSHGNATQQPSQETLMVPFTDFCTNRFRGGLTDEFTKEVKSETDLRPEGCTCKKSVIKRKEEREQNNTLCCCDHGTGSGSNPLHTETKSQISKLICGSSTNFTNPTTSNVVESGAHKSYKANPETSIEGWSCSCRKSGEKRPPNKTETLESKRDQIGVKCIKTKNCKSAKSKVPPYGKELSQTKQNAKPVILNVSINACAKDNGTLKCKCCREENRIASYCCTCIEKETGKARVREGNPNKDEEVIDVGNDTTVSGEEDDISELKTHAPAASDKNHNKDVPKMKLTQPTERNPSVSNKKSLKVQRKQKAVDQESDKNGLEINRKKSMNDIEGTLGNDSVREDSPNLEDLTAIQNDQLDTNTETLGPQNEKKIQIFTCMCGRAIACPYGQMMQRPKRCISNAVEKCCPIEKCVPASTKNAKESTQEAVNESEKSVESTTSIEKIDPMQTAAQAKQSLVSSEEEDTGTEIESVSKSQNASNGNEIKNKVNTKVVTGKQKLSKDINKSSTPPLKANGNATKTHPNAENGKLQESPKSNVNEQKPKSLVSRKANTKAVETNGKPNSPRTSNARNSTAYKATAKSEIFNRNKKAKAVTAIKEEILPNNPDIRISQLKPQVSPETSAESPAKDSTPPIEKNKESRENSVKAEQSNPRKEEAETESQTHTDPEGLYDLSDEEFIRDFNLDIGNTPGSYDVMVVTKRTHFLKRDGAEKIEEKRLIITKPSATDLEICSPAGFPQPGAEVIKKCKRIGDNVCTITITKEKKGTKQPMTCECDRK